MTTEERVMLYRALRSKQDIAFKQVQLADGKFAIDIEPFAIGKA
ncbi:MAG: hypothetical protein Q8K91_08010 [Hylemonella sp.]|nr:hypothetical protein [Hylemonella sp.]MDP1937136.1 hypothetical protein [Hylemonella sp.]